MWLYISWFNKQLQVNVCRTRPCCRVFVCCRCCIMDVSGLEGSDLKRSDATTQLRHSHAKKNAFYSFSLRARTLKYFPPRGNYYIKTTHAPRQKKCCNLSHLRGEMNVLPTSLHNAHNMLASEHSGDGLLLFLFCPSDSRERI